MSSTTLADFVSRLGEAVPVRNGTPSSNQYEEAVKRAVADFSRRCGYVKVGTLSIVSGTANYTLPGDFVKLIRLESLSSPDGIINTGNGLIPVSANWSERYVIADGQITFYPTPTYTLARDYEYQAGWFLSASLAFDGMSDTEAGIVLMLAESHALMMQANRAAQEAWNYQVGAEGVNKTQLADKLRAQALARQSEYVEAAKQYASGGGIGTIGRRSQYDLDAYS